MKQDNDIFAKIKNEWNEDCKINIDKLDQESLKIPVLHSKYLNKYSIIKQLKIDKENERKILKLKLYNHYNGKELIDGKDSAFRKITGVENIQRHIEADSDMLKIISQIEYLNMILDYITDVIKMIHNRSFQIKHAIDYQKFVSGIDI